MHSKGHIVPPLLREHLAVLRAFLIAIRDSPPLPGHVQERQQASQNGIDPLEPPQPIWETEAERVCHRLCISKCLCSTCVVHVVIHLK